MPDVRLAIKIDVDTERGTRVGVPPLVRLLGDAGIPACFLFSLGPDHTGRALRRVFRPGFLAKASRTSVVAVYGVRTLLNGVLLPGPHIARRHGALLASVRDAGFEVGIHCWDHVRWQDGLLGWDLERTRKELRLARDAFEQVFGEPARTAGSAGWQANANSLAAYDEADFLYASDARGESPFLPRCGDRVYRTLQIPTTLPTLDELLGRPEHPEEKLVDAYLGWLRPDALNVLTIHAELEGMLHRGWFRSFLVAAQQAGVRFVRLDEEARDLLERRDALPVCDLVQGSVPGRYGVLAAQGGTPCAAGASA